MISVAIQGGAMRSIYCLGAIRALTENERVNDVGAMHVSSAGCVSAAVLAHHLTKGNSITVSQMAEQFVNNLAGPRFIDSRRLQKIVDVDYLVEVIRDVTAIDVRSLAERGLVFEVALTGAENAVATYVDLAQSTSDRDLYEALRATMAIPVLYPPRVKLHGEAYVDGGIADPLPALRALQRSPDILVAISSVAKGTLGAAAEGTEARILKYAPGISSAVRHLMLTRNPLGAAIDKLLDLESFCGTRIVRISPSNPSLLGSRTETDKNKLFALEGLGYKDGIAALKELEEKEQHA